MPKGNNEMMQIYFEDTLYVGTSSTDLTMNLARRLKELTGEMTARFKQIIAASGTSN